MTYEETIRLFEKHCELNLTDDQRKMLVAVIEAAVANEREACAKIAFNVVNPKTGRQRTTDEIWRAIRARK